MVNNIKMTNGTNGIPSCALISYFLKGKDDAEKVLVFTVHQRNWEAIEGDLKEWLEANWDRWEEEQPDWFTDAWKSQLPDELLSAVELRRQKMVGGGQRRRSSLSELIGGTQVREERGLTR
jgi:hypothetical protein